MAQSIMVLSNNVVWGNGSYNNTSDLKVGKTGSSSYRGRIRFPSLGIPNAIIQSITFRMNRIDEYSNKNLKLRVTYDSSYGASGQYSRDISVSGGRNMKEWSLTAAKDIIQAYTGSWYIHILPSSDDNSYCEFAGDEDTDSRKPRVAVVYENATVDYYIEGGWQKCLVNYYKDGVWVQCIPYIYKDGAWVQV